MAWRASPKPMKAILGLPSATHSSWSFGRGALVTAARPHPQMIAGLLRVCYMVRNLAGPALPRSHIPHNF
jgi:hypothetical protein